MTMTAAEDSQNEFYDENDVFAHRGTPPLERKKPKLEPTPSPPPDTSDSDECPTQSNPANAKKTKRRLKALPSQGDAVLISLMGGGKALEVSRAAASTLLPSDDEMSEGGQKDIEVNVESAVAPTDLQAVAAGALKQFTASVTAAPIKGEDATNGSATNGDAPTEPIPSMKTEPMEDVTPHHATHMADVKGGTELAPIQEHSPKSDKPNGMTLPSISSISSISASLGGISSMDLKHRAEAAAAGAADKDMNGVHRPSFSQSPPRPPIFQVPQSIPQGGHGSPPISPNEAFHRELPSPGRGSAAAPSPYYYPSNPRRPSLASDGPPYSGATPSDYTSSNTETPNTDQSGSTPASIPSGIDIRMSIDGITNPQIGGFQCSYPGCTAQPFQTQYLLNSHANVHSSNRPHYCPVKGMSGHIVLSHIQALTKSPRMLSIRGWQRL